MTALVIPRLEPMRRTDGIQIKCNIRSELDPAVAYKDVRGLAKQDARAVLSRGVTRVGISRGVTTRGLGDSYA